jgi:hypothetical protein
MLEVKPFSEDTVQSTGYGLSIGLVLLAAGRSGVGA